MAKKRRSAKQRANDKRLGAMARARGRRSAPKRRRKSTRKSIKRRAPRRTMAKRRSASGKKSGILGKIPLINNPTFKKAATGIGVATLGVAVLGLVLPQIANQPLVRPILALAGGGVPGVVAQFLVQGGGNLSNILGGGGSTGGSGGFTPGFG